jgi:hypothetical protein
MENKKAITSSVLDLSGKLTWCEKNGRREF